MTGKPRRRRRGRTAEHPDLKPQPGIPDFYEGTELWDLNLVDPDNRRPVDYAHRRDILKALSCPREVDDAAMAADLLAHRRDGRIKMYVTARALAARHRHRNAFTGATIEAERDGAASAIAAATLFKQFPVALLVAP